MSTQAQASITLCDDPITSPSGQELDYPARVGLDLIIRSDGTSLVRPYIRFKDESLSDTKDWLQARLPKDIVRLEVSDEEKPAEVFDPPFSSYLSNCSFPGTDVAAKVRNTFGEFVSATIYATEWVPENVAAAQDNIRRSLGRSWIQSLNNMIQSLEHVTSHVSSRLDILHSDTTSEPIRSYIARHKHALKSWREADIAGLKQIMAEWPRPDNISFEWTFSPDATAGSSREGAKKARKDLGRAFKELQARDEVKKATTGMPWSIPHLQTWVNENQIL